MHIRRHGMVAAERLTPEGYTEIEGDTFNPQSFVDNMAQPFLDISERLEAARIHGAEDETWFALLDTTVFLWRFVSNYLPTQFDKDTPLESAELLQRISAFMDTACAELRADRQDALITRVIELNMNMCQQLLNLNFGGEPIAPESAAA